MAPKLFFLLSVTLFSCALCGRPSHIFIAGHEIDTRVKSTEYRDSASVGNGRYDLLIQVADPTHYQVLQQAIESPLTHYYPDFAFRVNLSEEELRRVEKLNEAVWIGPYKPEYKLGARSILEGSHLALNVLVQRDPASLAAVRSLVVSTHPHLRVTQESSVPILHIWCPPPPTPHGSPCAPLADLVGRLIAHPAVLALDRYYPPVPHNDRGHYTIQSGGIRGYGPIWEQGLHGEGEVVAIQDSGLDAANCFFHDDAFDPAKFLLNTPLEGHRKIAGYYLYEEAEEAVDQDSHGTHTAGTLAGDPPEPLEKYRGIAYKARLHVAKHLGVDDKDYPPKTGVSSNSWGHDDSFSYDLNAQAIDEACLANPNILFVFSSGNDGPKSGTVNSPGLAKNVLTVGNERKESDAYFGSEFLSLVAERFRAELHTDLCYHLDWETMSDASLCGWLEGDSSTCPELKWKICDQGGWLDDEASACEHKEGYPWPTASACPAALKSLYQGMLAENNEDTLHITSGVGPTADGRIKPDVVAPGHETVSARSGQRAPFDEPFCEDTSSVVSENIAISAMTGTSMSAPLVAGAAALVRQYFREGWYPSGKKNVADGFVPSAALLKAVLIASGTALTGSVADTGAPIASYPNPFTGWGRVNLEGALYFANSPRSPSLVVKEFTLATHNDAYSALIQASGPFKVVLVWMDPAASTGAAKTLVNDLDLALTSPREGYFGNHGSTPDRVNNVEVVWVRTPSGQAEYTAHVTAVNMPKGPQSAALVIVGKVEHVFEDTSTEFAERSTECLSGRARPCPVGGGTRLCRGGKWTECLQETEGYSALVLGGAIAGSFAWGLLLGFVPLLIICLACFSRKPSHSAAPTPTLNPLRGPLLLK